MANVKVTIKVAAQGTDKLYLVGSTSNLGNWDPKDAVKLEFCENCGMFTTTKQFAEGTTVEFKVLKAKNYDSVEKGTWGEVLENHSFVAAKGLEVQVDVFNFAN